MEKKLLLIIFFIEIILFSLPFVCAPQEIQSKNSEIVRQLTLDAQSAFNSADYETAIKKSAEILRIDIHNAQAAQILNESQKKINEGRIEKYFKEGDAYYKKVSYELAIASWSKILEIEPSNSKAIEKIQDAQAAIRERELRKKAEAEKEKRQKIKAGYDKGTAFYSKGEYEKAIEEWKNISPIAGKDKKILAKIENARRLQIKKKEKEERIVQKKLQAERQKEIKEKKRMEIREKKGKEGKIRAEKERKEQRCRELEQKRKELRQARVEARRQKEMEMRAARQRKEEMKEGKIREDKGREGEIRGEKGKREIREMKLKEAARQKPVEVLGLSEEQKMMAEGLVKTAAEFYSQGNIEAAIKNCEKAIEIDFYNYKTHNELGKLYEEKGMFEEAEKEFLTAFGLKPDYKSEHYKNLVGLYQTQIETELEAKNITDKLFQEGLKYYNQKEFQEAIKEWERIFRLDPDNKMAKEYIDKAHNALEKKRRENKGR